MNSNQDDIFKGYRFPPSIIQHAVWLYFTFPHSFRNIELLLAERHIKVSHESIRKWCYRIGPILAKKLRKRQYLWRAVDSDGMVLYILVQKRRNAAAAKRFFENVLESTPSRSRVTISDEVNISITGLRIHISNKTSRAKNATVQFTRSSSNIFCNTTLKRPRWSILLL